jgi:hypothetical protein
MQQTPMCDACRVVALNRAGLNPEQSVGFWCRTHDDRADIVERYSVEVTFANDRRLEHGNCHCSACSRRHVVLRTNDPSAARSMRDAQRSDDTAARVITNY